jgi:hypothetical protein
VPGAEVTNELARLSQENRELRSQLSLQKDDFNGLTFDELIKLLRNDSIPADKSAFVWNSVTQDFLPPDVAKSYSGNPQAIRHLGDAFEFLSFKLATGKVRAAQNNETHLKLVSYGLVETDQGLDFKMTHTGLRFRNRLLTAGDLEFRRKTFWTLESDND